VQRKLTVIVSADVIGYSAPIRAAQTQSLNWWKIDSDLDPLRGDPRFEAMIEGAEARLAKSSSTRSP